MTDRTQPNSRRPWHLPLPPAPWPNVQTTEPPSDAQVAALVTAASERHQLRLHGARR